ncbi:MAG: TetR/AcrR family transcriptional regulator [Ardenticatenaceae bacterium]|nr:TetR/AcrR family transcriptional regulator [Ardenticatenaceae bacterium]
MARPLAENARNTRQNALDMMARLIQEFGYNGVSMNQLADRVGIRKASLYHHFPNGKEQLVGEMLEGMINHHAAGYQQAILAGANVREKLQALLKFNLAESSEVSHVMSDSLRFLSEGQQAHLGNLFVQGQFMKVKQVIEGGIESGELKPHDSELSTWMFLSLMGEMGVVEQYVSQSDFPNKLVTLFLEGLM